MGFYFGHFYFQTPAERLASALKTITSTTSPTTTTSTTNTTSTPAPTTNTAPKTNTATATWQKISQQNNLNLAARANIQAALKSKQALTTNLAAVQSAKKQTFTPKKVTYDDSEYITENGIDYHVVGGKKYQIIQKFPTEAEIASKQFHAGDSSGNNNSLNLGIPGVSNASASTGGSTKSASGGKTTTATSVYDISQNLKDVQAQAKQYGASVAIPKTTQYKTQAEAQKALDAYVASTNKALEAKINSNVASAQPQAAAPTRGYYDGLTPTQRNEVDSWNTNNKAQGINDAINPDWVVWRNYKLSGPEPAKFWKDATNSSARDEYQARMDAEHAESQRQLAEAYAATQRAAGTTHAKSTTAVTNNGKSSSQIYNEQKSLKPSTSKLQVVSAKTVAPSVAAKSQPVVVKKTVEPVVVKKPTTKELMAINSKTKQTKPTIVKSTSAKPVAVSLANKNNLQRTQTIQAASHAGQIQLKNGTWIDKIQKTGAANPNSGKTSIFSESAKVHYDTKVANARAAEAEFQANRTAAGSGKLVDNKGYAINQITDKSGNTKISRNTLGQAITISTPVVVAGQKAYYTRSGGQTARDQRDAEKTNYMSLLGAKYRQEDSTTELLNKKPTADTFVGAKRFKTVDQINHEKVETELAKYRQEHKDSKVAQVAASLYGATYDKQALKDTEASGNAYWSKNVTSRVLPTTETFEQKRNAAFTKVGLEDERQAISKKIYDNPLGKAALDVGVDSYNYVRDKPVSTAKEVGILVAEGYLLGGGIKAVSGVTSAGLFAGSTKVANLGTKTALKLETLGAKIGSRSTKISRASLFAERGAYRAADASQAIGKYTSKKLYITAGKTEASLGVGLGSKLVYDTKKQYDSGDYNGIVRSAGELVIGSTYFGKGGKFGERLVDRARTIGAKEIPASDILNADVLSGKTKFPMTKHETPVESVIESFKDSETGESIGYHASPNPLYPEVRASVARKSDQPGLYVSPLQSGASPYFMRVTPYLEPVGTVEALFGKKGVFGSKGVFRQQSVKTWDGKILRGKDGAGAFSTAIKNVKVKDVANTITGKAQNIIAKATDTKAQKHNPNYPSNPQIETPKSISDVQSIFGEAKTQIKEALLGTQNIQPTVTRIHLPFAVRRMPEDIRLDLKGTQAAMEKANPGESYITFKFERNIKRGNAETEATIVPGTKLQKLPAERRYFEYNGRRVVLQEFKARPSSEVDIALERPFGRMSDEEGAAIYKQALEEVGLEKATVRSKESPFDTGKKRAETRELKSIEEYEKYNALPRRGIRIPYTGSGSYSSGKAGYSGSYGDYKAVRPLYKSSSKYSAYTSGLSYKSGSNYTAGTRNKDDSKIYHAYNSGYGNSIGHSRPPEYKPRGGKYEYDPHPTRHFINQDQYTSTSKPYTLTPSSASYTPKPYTPKPNTSNPVYGGGSGGGGGSGSGNGSGGGNGGNGDRVIISPIYPQPKKRRDDDTKKADIKKAVIARDKALISNTKVASFKQMYGAAKKPRPSPFKK